jgi:hypothetical protein
MRKSGAKRLTPFENEQRSFRRSQETSKNQLLGAELMPPVGFDRPVALAYSHLKIRSGAVIA